jgi:hypothetical protein
MCALRHSAPQWMPENRVSEWDIEILLGHRRPGATEIYPAFDPDYLKGGGSAGQSFACELRAAAG